MQHHLADRIEVITDFADIDPIVCYPSRLNQVFLCMLDNAIEDRGRIEISTRREDDRLYVVIKDSGIGIPEENLERIFQPGFTTKGVGVGTGLGLSICHQILREHGGEIEVESRPGEGATFTTILSYEFSGFGHA